MVDQGYVIDWSSNGCKIKHPERGEVQCWRRQGCPVLSENALVPGLCARIKALQGFNAMHAVEIKSAAETSFPITFQASIGKAVEESLLATPASEKPSIAKPQTLLEIQNYLTRNDWLVIEDINSSLIQKQNTLAYRLRQLGVVSLHEQTCKAAVAVILNTLSSLPAYDVIHSMVMDFKGAFAASGGACKSGIHINKYPVNPSGLPPQVFKDAYGSEVPQPKVLEKLSVLKQHPFEANQQIAC